MSLARPLWINLFACALLAIPPCLLFSPWLTPYALPQRGGPDLPFRAGDLTPLFYVWCTVTRQQLWLNHEFPVWSDHIYCGEPFFAKAQVGVLSLTTLLLAFLPAELVATWTFLLHLWIAGIATYFSVSFLLKLTRSEPAPVAPTFFAGLAGALFYQTCALMLEHTIQGHGPIVLAACYTPAILTAALYAIQQPGARIISGILAGISMALQFLTGGATMTLYSGLGVLAIATLASVLTLFSNPRNGFRAVGGAIAGTAISAIVAGGLAAVKLLPAQALMPVSNRAGGLDPRIASLPIIEFPMPRVLGLVDPTGSARHGALLIGPCILTLLAFARRKDRLRATLLLLLAIGGAIVATRAEAFVLLHHYFPGFKYQRIPQRALVLFYAPLGLLCGIGTASLLHWLRDAVGSRRALHVLCLPAAGIACCTMACAENLMARPPLPPTQDIRREQQANQLLQYVANLPRPFRFHQVESRDRNWGIEHVATPLGIETFVGWDHMWLLDYLGAEGVVGRDILPYVEASYRATHPERFWGIANVRWVSSTRHPPAIETNGFARRATFRPLNKLHLHRTFQDSPLCQPDKSDGPYIYANDDSLPRAWFTPNAIVVLGEKATRRLAVYRIMDLEDFAPDRTVVIELANEHSSVLQTLPGIRAVILAVRNPEPDGPAQAHLPDVPVVRWNPWTEPAPRALLDVVNDVQRLPAPTPSVSYRKITNARRRLETATDEPGYIVLSEKFASFPGWTASGTPSPTLLVAYGVFTAIPVAPGQHVLLLEYNPPGLRTGAVISVVSLVTTCFGLVATKRRRRKDAADTPKAQPTG